MDGPHRVELPDSDIEERAAGAAPAPSDVLATRLTAVEEALQRLEGRLSELGGDLERRIEDAVTAELESVAAQLRRTVAELGRMLVGDRGRISQVLAEHREAIVAALRTPPPEEAVSAPDGEAEDDQGEQAPAVGRPDT
jgi:hypothetical protein